MFVIRLIFIIAAIWLARKAWLMAKKAIENNPGAQSQQPEKPAEMMVVCAQCKTHLPESSAIKSEGNCFCSQDHKEAFEREQP